MGRHVGFTNFSAKAVAEEVLATVSSPLAVVLGGAQRTMDRGRQTRDNGAMTVCKRVRYSGRVQGVGFRYTVQHLAEDFPVGGYVRNMPDGDVEVVAEGESDQVGALLDAIGRRMESYIEKTVVQDEVSGGGYRGFRIRY
jgi:acylphosphatase